MLGVELGKDPRRCRGLTVYGGDFLQGKTVKTVRGRFCCCGWGPRDESRGEWDLKRDKDAKAQRRKVFLDRIDRIHKIRKRVG